MFQRTSLSLADARNAVAAILRATSEKDNPAAVVVVDDYGELLCCARQDGAPSRMLRRARAKAYTSANLGLDTVVFRDQDQVVKTEERTLNDWGDPMITSLQGGLAIKVNGKVVGAISCSGNSTERDEELAGIGLKAMGLPLD